MEASLTIAVFKDLCGLYSDRNIQMCSDYLESCERALGEGLAYSTPAMYGITKTLLSSASLFAHNLAQNATDEAKGAARVRLVAGRYASGELLAKMKRHVADEFKHSVQFRKLIPLTGITHFRRAPGEVADEIDKVLNFDDDLRSFLCRVHSIEIRSWTVLRIYIDILAHSPEPSFRKAIPVLEDILADEITHVLYTGKQISDWLEEDRGLALMLDQCFAHTNRETWRDIAHMTEYLADNFGEIWVCAPGEELRAA